MSSYQTLLKEIFQEHRTILARLVEIRDRNAPDLRETISLICACYDSVIRDHASKEEGALLALAGKEGVDLDGEALRFAHSTLEAGREGLEAEIRRAGTEQSDTRFRKEIGDFIQLIRDHFYEEENFLFETDQERIFEESGSY